MKSLTKFSIAGVVAVSAALTLAGCDEATGEFDAEKFFETTTEESEFNEDEVANGTEQEASELSGDTTELAEILQGLHVEDLDRNEFGERSKSYDREEYPHWSVAGGELGWYDSNPNCNSRWATLWRDGTGLEWDDYDNCIIADVGHWEDDYGVIDENTGEVDYLVTEDPSDIDIDHIVALHDAHVSGMYATDADDPKRERLANDPDNLVISDASANRSKGDSSPEDYMPPGEYRCTYAEKYITVSDRYDLSVSTGDVERLEETLQECS